MQHFSLSPLTNGETTDKWFPVLMLHQYTHVLPQVVLVAVLPYQDFCRTEKFGNTGNEKMSIIWYLRKTEAEAGSVSIVQYQLLAHYCGEMYFIT